MKYLCLVYGEEKKLHSCPRARGMTNVGGDPHVHIGADGRWGNHKGRGNRAGRKKSLCEDQCET
jgi:hypothetical protein